MAHLHTLLILLNVAVYSPGAGKSCGVLKHALVSGWQVSSAIQGKCSRPLHISLQEHTIFCLSSLVLV